MTPEFNPGVSMVRSAAGRKLKPVQAGTVINAIRTGKYRVQVGAIRDLYRETLATSNGDHKQAKRAIDGLKKNLPAVMWNGKFTGRGDDKLAKYSGLLCADLDGLDVAVQVTVLNQASADPYVFGAFRSPSGSGVKLVFRVQADATRHDDNFLAVKEHVAAAYGLSLDDTCRNIERLCFVSDDPDAFWNAEAEILPWIAVEPASLVINTEPLTAALAPIPQAEIAIRRKVAERLLGAIEWKTDVQGFCECPEQRLHSTPAKSTDTRIMIDHVPTISCFHNSCTGAIQEMNGKLRAEIRQAQTLISLDERLASRRFRVGTKPADEEPRYFLGPVPISTVGNLTTISAGVKTGKSSVLAAMIAAAITHDPKLVDCFDFESRNPRGLTIIHLDTEQSRADHYALIERAMCRARITEPPPWFMSYCVTGFNVVEQRLSLRRLLDKGLHQCGGIHSVLLDGVGDLVHDVNDPEECNAFVTELHALAIEFQCPIIGAIHFNPGTEKTRGHLGSQLERKAETNLRLDKIDGATVVWSEKNRRAPIRKTHGPRFAWSDEAGMHVSVQTLCDLKADARRAEMQFQAAAVFNHANEPALRWIQMVESLRIVAKPISESGARKRIERMLEAGVIAKNPNGLYALVK